MRRVDRQIAGNVDVTVGEGHDPGPLLRRIGNDGIIRVNGDPRRVFRSRIGFRIVLCKNAVITVGGDLDILSLNFHLALESKQSLRIFITCSRDCDALGTIRTDIDETALNSKPFGNALIFKGIGRNGNIRAINIDNALIAKSCRPFLSQRVYEKSHGCFTSI